MKKCLAVVLAALLCVAGLEGKASAQIGPNFPYYVLALAIGTPGFVMNSSGTNYGLEFNSSGANSSTTWNLGYGVASSTLPNGQPAFGPTGTYTAVISWNTSNQAAINLASDAIAAQNVFQVNSVASDQGEYFLGYNVNGWLEFHSQQANSGQIAASVPTVSNCSTSPSVVSGTDQAGDVTLGSSPTNICVVTFASKPTNIPHCFCNDTSSPTNGCTVRTLGAGDFTMQAAGIQAGGGTDTFSAADRLDWVCLGHA